MLGTGQIVIGSKTNFKNIFYIYICNIICIYIFYFIYMFYIICIYIHLYIYILCCIFIYILSFFKISCYSLLCKSAYVFDLHGWGLMAFD